MCRRSDRRGRVLQNSGDDDGRPADNWRVPSPLLPEPNTPRTAPRGNTEPAIRWLLESTWDEAVAARQNVNAWYADFPDPGGMFAMRLTSENNHRYYQSLDELYVHHLLLRGAGDVRYEEDGAGPDFRIYDSGRLIAAVEVFTLFEAQDWVAQGEPHGRLADELNKRVPPTAGWFVMFDIERADRQPSPKRFAEWVRAEIGALPAPEEWPQPADGSLPDLPIRLYAEAGVQIVAEFVPMRSNAKTRNDPDGQIVGTGPIIGGAVQTSQRLRDRLRHKAGGRYDIGDVPFLIVGGISMPFCADHDVLGALYGTEAVVAGTGGQLVRRNDGFFGADNVRPQGRQTRVSAVSIIRNMLPWRPEDADVATLLNPFAQRPWLTEVVPCTRIFGPVRKVDAGWQFGWTAASTSAHS